MNNKIVLAFFIELHQNKPNLNCEILDDKKKFQIYPKFQKNNIHFFYIINEEKNNCETEDIIISIYSESKKLDKSEKININSNKILFLYSINFPHLKTIDTKTYYKFNEFLKFIEEEKLSQDDINEFYLNTLKHLEYLKGKTIINSNIIIDLIFRVVENESTFKKAITFFYDLENIVDDKFETQEQYSKKIEYLKKQKFENEFKKKIDTFILYYYNLTSEEKKFDEFIKNREELITPKNLLFKKWTENFINYKIDNFQTEEDISLILSKCKTYNLVFKIIFTKKKYYC